MRSLRRAYPAQSSCGTARGGELEAIGLKTENGAVLEASGASAAFPADCWITDLLLFYAPPHFPFALAYPAREPLLG